MNSVVPCKADLLGDHGIRVVWVDPDLIVVDKPSGLLSVPGKGPEGGNCLSAHVQAVWPDALVVHRLDMSTSGLMVMARGADMQRALSVAFARRLTRKRYEAIVWGNPEASTPAGPSLTPDCWHTIELPLIVDWPNRPRSKICQDTGKPSLTRWRTLQAESCTDHTRLELEPVTGRSHQLRVHLMSIGHPILGDNLYAHADALAAAPRLLLHAKALQLLHPATGTDMSWESPPVF